MLITVAEFCARVEDNLNGFVDELQEKTGRSTEDERRAWQASFRKLSVTLAKDRLASFHLHFGRDGGSLLVEYRLPASSSWCDIVLLGSGKKSPIAIILELKHWDTHGDQPGPYPGVIQHHGMLALHPCQQVRGYVEYCRRFHSAVLHRQAEVKGCAYFTGAASAEAYLRFPHDALVRDFPLFTHAQADSAGGFVEYLTERLHKPDASFAKDFEIGVYHQDRGFVEQLAEQILHPETSPFVLLENQQLGFELCRGKVRDLLAAGAGKAVIIIEGPPGSGKSVLAARLWADLVQDPTLQKGNVVITTTSTSQRTNWEYVYEELAKSPAGKGIIKTANSYAPETIPWFVKRKATMTPESWKQNIEAVQSERGDFRCPNDSYLVSIVDEAHGLINPVAPKARAGVSGWPILAGPQAYHIIRSSRVSIFLMDAAQSFRDIETTTRQDIEECATALNATVAQTVSLEGNQYRCGGSKEYVDWLEILLGMKDGPIPNVAWRKTDANPRGKMIFELIASPSELEQRLREHHQNDKTVRLVSSYSQPWKTRGVSRPHDQPPKQKDFCFSCPTPDGSGVWAKIWNYVPTEGDFKNDYACFIQAPKGSHMADDPLCEVGCPYTVRGFDYSYLGVLWCSDLVRRGDRWSYNLNHIHESAWKQTISAAKRDKSAAGPHRAELLHRLQIAYRILFSRAITGIFVWIEDEETRRFVTSKLPG